MKMSLRFVVTLSVITFCCNTTAFCLTYKIVDLGENSTACGINDLGQIVGGYLGQAYLWDSNGMHPINGLREADAINNNGDIMGYYYNPASGLNEAAVIHNGVKRILGLYRVGISASPCQ